MKKIFFMGWVIMSYSLVISQELYPYTEPASNMPAKSVSTKVSAMFGKDVDEDRLMQRHMPEVMFGFNNKVMVHASITMSDMHQQRFIFESARLYGKYRFLSIDDVHKHFRMAAFGAASYSRNHIAYNELNLMGDHSGMQGGLIATQLWNKLAVSGTGSWTEVFAYERRDKTLRDDYAFSALNYSLSAGYLLFPIEYKNYNQTNVNLYAEVLGSKNNLPKSSYFVDLAPSIQFIFRSTGKLNLGYRFQLEGNVYRLATRSFMVSYEHIFLNALRKKRKQTVEK